MSDSIKKPSLYYHFSEVFRAFLQFFKGFVFLRNHKFRSIGNNAKVVVIPGLMSSDLTTSLLRKFLKKSNFDAYGWEMGMNYGRHSQLKILIEKIEKLSINSNQKIILIGWSMGGIFAREVAKNIPNSIERVITVGSPFANVNAPNWAKFMFDLVNKKEKVDLDFVAQLHEPAPMRTLALFSKSDGIVPWEACRERIEDKLHENKEINSSHFGMGMNKDVMLEIEKELCQTF